MATWTFCPWGVVYRKLHEGLEGQKGTVGEKAGRICKLRTKTVWASIGLNSDKVLPSTVYTLA